MTVYVKYSASFPGLPIAVADSAAELARMTGMTEGSVYSSISKKRRTFAKIEIEEESENGANEHI